uniref:centromere protein X isoform X1 n=1 Tax=Doryrhamphus excisus TaxID=161450 RepID=UPI0025AE31ED|nr:centromere protein X isoform X1 [Doryrhamphus excisus]
MADKDTEVTFKKDTVSKLLSSFFKEDKTRLSGEAALLMAEMLRIFVQEAAVRSQKQAGREDCDQVGIEHFEKILPQLVLPACATAPFIKASWSSWKQLE